MTAYVLPRLQEVPGLHLLGTAAECRGAVFSFWMDDIHAHDIAQILDHYGVAVRAGHHCAQPLHLKFGVPATARASFYLYNTPEEADRLIAALYKAKEVFA